MKQYPSLEEVYSRYGISNPRTVQDSSSTWNRPLTLTSEIFEKIERVGSGYLPRELAPFNYTGSTVPPPDIEYDKKVFFEGPLSCDPTITMNIFEVAGVSSMIDRERKRWAFWLALKKDRQRMAEGFLLHENNNNNWEFSHRLVTQPFRGNGLFNDIAFALEKFVAIRARIHPQTIYLSTGQPDVALTFLKRGYKPTLTDTNKVERMLTADKLRLLPARRPLVFTGGSEHEDIPQDQTSLYCFESTVANDPEMLIVENSFRVTLEKRVILTQ